MLVPIDGSHSSGSVVPYAAALAERLGCEVDLLLVEPTSGVRLPHPEHHRPQPRIRDGEAGALIMGSSTPAYVREANERYVARHVEEFAALGVPARGAVVCGEAVEEILRAALDLRSDVIAMASRKLSNFSRRETGSIAEEVLWRSKLPVLLIAAA
ncbi:MAG TPA: universal stress protein [Dehalococcoidia bacterium]|nr:universal stress protein [Dehalococcoidia bacterium]